MPTTGRPGAIRLLELSQGDHLAVQGVVGIERLLVLQELPGADGRAGGVSRPSVSR
jgi:hypothetical protein